MANKKNVATIAPVDDRFTFATSDDYGHDAKLETKPIGYFRDAFRRFAKNKASIVAAIIILLLVLFAIILPLVSSPRMATVRDSYYAKLGPRHTAMYGLLNGGKTSDISESTLLTYYADAVGANYYIDDNGVEHMPTIAETYNTELQPVISRGEGKIVYQGSTKTTIYTTNVDQYLAVGFIYKDFDLETYQNILDWQEKTGKQVFYPLIDLENPNNIDKNNCNFWYKMSTARTTAGMPLDKNDNIMKFSDNLKFVDIFLRDDDGNPVYVTRNGGGTSETANYHTRILYYNYYQYMHGEYPNYLMGLDAQGYSLDYRMATGMRLSFVLAICVSAINFIIGAIYGAIEGYYGGTTDIVMERITDILSEVPFIVVATLFNLHIAKIVGPFPSLLFAFVMTGWIGTASRVRSQFYRFKNQEYVLAARTLGARDRRIIWKHIFPNTLGTIITSSVLVIPGVIFTESTLSYLGIITLGTASTTSLGTLLSEASTLWTQFPHLMVFPAIVITLLMVCFNLFGNGLRDAFNPTLRGSDE